MAERIFSRFRRGLEAACRRLILRQGFHEKERKGDGK